MSYKQFLLSLGVAGSLLGLHASESSAQTQVVHDHYAHGNYGQEMTVFVDDIKAGYSLLFEAGFHLAGVDFSEKSISILLPKEDPLMIYQERVRSLLSGSLLRSSKVKKVSNKRVDPGYHNYDELVEVLLGLEQVYPDILALEVIGQSSEGRDIYAVKISDNVQKREVDEPVVLFNSVHHAREVVTAEVALDIVQHLVNNYNNAEKLTRYINQNEIWIVPVVNPDGHMKVFRGNTLWRKNTRKGYGIDLNRNYPGSFDTCGGSSWIPISDVYRGPEAGSEPETQALMGLVKKIKPAFNISFHSFSEMVLYPYGCEPLVTETQKVLEPIGKELADLYVTDNGTGTYAYGTPWELLYSADGSDMDWMYQQQQVIAYTFEVGSRAGGFQPSYAQAVSISERARPSWMHLLNRAQQSSIYVQTQGAAKDHRVMAVLKANQEQVSQKHQLRADGSTQIILNPGMYDIQLLDAEGVVLSQEQVTVGLDRVNILL